MYNYSILFYAIKLNTLLSLRSTQALVGEHFKDSAYCDIFNIYHTLSHIYNIYILRS
jgi:hypothetical protein